MKPISIFALILVLTAIGLEFGFSSIDPWRLPHAPDLRFVAHEFPSLAGVALECTEPGPVIRIDLAKKSASCGAILRPEMVACEGGAPLRGFADKIRCAKMESARCSTGGMQVLGLFKDDSACANSTSETDLGPPAVRDRSESL